MSLWPNASYFLVPIFWVLCTPQVATALQLSCPVQLSLSPPQWLCAHLELAQHLLQSPARQLLQPRSPLNCRTFLEMVLHGDTVVRKKSEYYNNLNVGTLSMCTGQITGSMQLAQCVLQSYRKAEFYTPEEINFHRAKNRPNSIESGGYYCLKLIVCHEWQTVP